MRIDVNGVTKTKDLDGDGDIDLIIVGGKSISTTDSDNNSCGKRRHVAKPIGDFRIMI